MKSASKHESISSRCPSQYYHYYYYYYHYYYHFVRQCSTEAIAWLSVWWFTLSAALQQQQHQQHCSRSSCCSNGPFHMQISWRWQASDNGRRLPFNCLTIPRRSAKNEKPIKKRRDFFFSLSLSLSPLLFWCISICHWLVIVCVCWSP